MGLSHLKQRVHNSLRLKLAVILSVATAFLTVGFTSYFIVNERHELLTRLEDKGELLVTTLAGSIQIPLYAGFNEEVAMHVTEMFSYGDIAAIKVFTGSGELVASAAAHATPAETAGLKITRTLTSLHGLQAPEAVLLGEVPSPRQIGTIELTMDQRRLADATRNLLLTAVLLAALFWLVTNTVTFMVLGKVTRTFRQLMAGVRNIEADDLTSRIPTSGTDEPGRALAAINSLAEALQRKKEENQRLQAEIVKGLRSELDEEKTRNMAKLIQTNRMTSLGLLVSSMAHEINNPNGAIRLAGEILEKAWHDIVPILDELAAAEGDFNICGRTYSCARDDIDTAVDAILRSTTRIERVVQNLRTYSLGDRENQQISSDLNRIAENAVTIVRAHGKMERVVITTNLAAGLPAIVANPFQLEQVVINLLLNAIQAMAASGGREIELTTETDRAKNEVLLTVRDSGPGIPAENLPHIFEPFFSTRLDEGGSGLGLYISNFLVREQNGTLELLNNEDGGCRGVIRLPAGQTVTDLPH